MKCEFEWDSAKDATNRRKHGLSFETAVSVFLDPLAVSECDRSNDLEDRWRTLGVVGNRVLLVVHGWRLHDDGSETIRLISARYADGRERRRYRERRHGEV
ncbi:MAG: BrnT family toxin [Caulobacterales bacterium]|nr:BrnT family toxin [Caulobacterales bacterium]